MKTKTLSIVLLALSLILSACSTNRITSSTSEQPTPEVESLPATGYQAVPVDQVEVEVGVGSPIPVHVIVSGSLPDTCAQIEFVEQKQVGPNFTFALSTIPSSAEGCIQDALPFRIALPLNVVNLPAGSYAVEVNGSRATFELDTANTTASLPAADSAITKDDILVDSVNVEIGVGSPLPVHAIVSLNLPNTCAQLGEVRLHRDGTTFFVRLIASLAERADCRADSLPFRAEIPLNIVNLPEGPYQVNVNGATDSFDPRATPAGPGSGEPVQPAGSRFEFGNISFVLDPAIAASASGQVVPEKPGSPDGPYWDINPQYASISLEGYSQPQSAFEPVIAVYPVEDYRRLSPRAGEILDQLKDLLAQKPARPEQIPFLPIMNSGQIFRANVQYLDFQNGSGVRFLAVYSQAADPITNQDLVYTFQGLTADGRYAVSIFLPASHPSLPENPNALSQAEVDAIYQDYEKYSTDTASTLSAQPASSFTPGLENLDALVASLRID